MKNLRTTGMEEAVRDAIRNKPFFAVCVGQSKCSSNTVKKAIRRAWAFSRATSFAFASDRVDQTGARLKVPQMGWNQVTQTREHPMWNGITNGAWFYFVHSYYAKPTEADLTVGTTFYGEEVTVAVARDNVFSNAVPS